MFVLVTTSLVFYVIIFRIECRLLSKSSIMIIDAYNGKQFLLTLLRCLNYSIVMFVCVWLVFAGCIVCENCHY